MCLRLHDQTTNKLENTKKHFDSSSDSNMFSQPANLIVRMIFKAASPSPLDLLQAHDPPACLGGLPCPYVSKTEDFYDVSHTVQLLLFLFFLLINRYRYSRLVLAGLVSLQVLSILEGLQCHSFKKKKHSCDGCQNVQVWL